MVDGDRYAPEVLGDEDDDGTMTESLDALREAVVGHRIARVESAGPLNRYSDMGTTIITLDNGKRVRLIGNSDCCAYTEVQAFLLHPERVDHMILGVGTTDGFDTWHIYADLGDVLELTVGWSCGNPFYYGYGFTITVEDADEVTL